MHSVASFPDPGMAWYLCKNPGNFTQSEQTVSVANTPSIINSLVLSFPWSNHSTQHTETQPVPPEPAAAALWERLQARKDEHTNIPTVTVGASGPVWLFEPARKRTYTNHDSGVMDTWPGRAPDVDFFVSCCLQGEFLCLWQEDIGCFSIFIFSCLFFFF